MMWFIMVLLLCAGSAWACPTLGLEHRLSPSTLEVTIVGMEDKSQALIEVISEHSVLHRALISNESVSFPRPIPGDYLVQASRLYPACEGYALKEITIGPLNSVHYRSSTLRLWPLSIALLLAITTLLSIVLILGR